MEAQSPPLVSYVMVEHEQVMAVVSPFTFRTGITNFKAAISTLEHVGFLGITEEWARWGENGLEIDFADHDDFVLFAISFRGSPPC